MKKKFVYVIVAIMLLVSLVYFSGLSEYLVPNAISENQSNSTKSNSSTETNPFKPQTVSYEGSATVMGMKYTVHSVTISKELLGLPNTGRALIGEKMDEDGTLLTDHSYVIIDMTMENISYPDSDICINGIAFITMKDDTVLTHPASFMDGIRSMNIDTEKADSVWFYYHETYNGEMLNLKIAMLEEDENLRNGNDFYLVPNPYAASLFNEYDDGELTMTWTSGLKCISMNEFMKEVDLP